MVSRFPAKDSETSGQVKKNILDHNLRTEAKERNRDNNM